MFTDLDYAASIPDSETEGPQIDFIGEYCKVCIPSGPDVIVSLDQTGTVIKIILLHRQTAHLIKSKITNIHCHQTGVTKKTFGMVRHMKIKNLLTQTLENTTQAG